MFRSLFSRRGAVALAAATIGVSSLSLAFAGTASATAYPDNQPNSSLIVGTGSQTAYDVMTALGTLFNGSPGCDLTASGSEPANGSYGQLGCGSTPYTTGSTGGEQGFNVSGENPYNDYSVEAPAVGSGNGAKALEAAGSGTASYQINFSRASAAKGNGTINQVAYAIDGVSYVAFNKVAGTETQWAKDKISSLSIAQIQDIWNGTVTCTIGTVTYNNNWVCLMNPLPSASKAAADAQPIDVYDAQTGSGTYSTWTGTGAADYSAGSSGLLTPGITCGTCEAGWVPNGGSSGTQVSAHSNLFENQMSYISQQVDAKDAIYFMSYGKFSTTCSGTVEAATYKDKTICAGTPATDYTTFGDLDSPTTGSPIVADQTTIQDAVSGASGAFPVTRYLYNLYNNGTATDPSSQATLNFISEDGFLCKASTAADIDPQTVGVNVANPGGLTYRQEIESTIEANGFFPLDVSGAFIADNEGALTDGADSGITDSGYAANDISNTFTIGTTTYSNTGTTNQGYCIAEPGGVAA